MQTGDPAVKNIWGTIQDASASLFEQGSVSQISISIAGQTAVTLSTANNAPDQARYLSQQYTGALTGDCTVTMPNVNKTGWAQNSTTGGHNVILTTGAGTTVTIPPDGYWYFYWCDGGTNISLPPLGAPPPVWHDAHLTRTFGTVYTNNTGVTMAVALVINGGGSTVVLNVDGVTITQITSPGGGGYQPLTVFVPNGATYEAVLSFNPATIIISWFELY